MTTTNSISEEYQEYLKNHKDQINLPRSFNLTPSQSKQIGERIAKELDISDDDTWAIIAMFLQQGASAAKCSGNLELEFKGKTYTLAQLRKGFKAAGQKKGLRKFARSNASSIMAISKALDIPGNLVLKIKRQQPDIIIEKDLSYWLSDFQAYNDDAPEKARILIQSTFKKKNKPSQNSNLNMT